MTEVLSADAVPLAERLDYWHHAVRSAFVPADITAPQDRPLSGTITTERLGHLTISTLDAGQYLVQRSKRQIAESRGEYLLLCLQSRGTALIVQDGRSALVRPGEFVFHDTTHPHSWEFPDRFRMLVFRVSRRVVGLPESDLRRVTAVTMRTDQGLAATVMPFLSGLASQADACRSDVAEMLARNVGDLITTLVAEQLGRDTDTMSAAQETLMLRIQAFIDAHLADPTLSRESIAAAHHISVRHLQRLFQTKGATVSGWIRRRRLDECRRELSRPCRSRPTVAAIAHRWGFISPAHFSRAFHAAYGMSPREWQTAPPPEV